MNKLLIVDDSSLVRRELTKLLSKEGFEVFTAKDGREALDMVLIGDFDVITMDINMPVMDGITATEKILEFCDKKSIPYPIICALTAYDDEENKKNCIDAGMSDFIVKPLTLKDLR